MSEVSRVLIVLEIFLLLACKAQKDEIRFAENRVVGTLVKVVDEKRSVFTLYVKDFKSGRVDDYTLMIGGFIKEHNIQAGDSIYKNANGNFASFYKLENGRFGEEIRMDF